MTKFMNGNIEEKPTKNIQFRAAEIYRVHHNLTGRSNTEIATDGTGRTCAGN